MTPPSPDFNFEVLLFGVLKDRVHSDRVMAVAPGDRSTVSVAELLQLLARQHPELEKYLPHVRVAVNREYVGAEYSIARGDEIALLPPVAGG
jgi:molybdopterin converting factor small subunit